MSCICFVNPFLTMKKFKPATSLETWPDNDVNRSLNIVGHVKYWHPYKFKYLCRDMHARNYRLYCRLGEYLLKKELIPADDYQTFTPVDYATMLIAIVKFLPHNFIPYKEMGCTTPAGDCDWSEELNSCLN